MTNNNDRKPSKRRGDPRGPGGPSSPGRHPGGRQCLAASLFITITLAATFSGGVVVGGLIL